MAKKQNTAAARPAAPAIKTTAPKQPVKTAPPAAPKAPGFAGKYTDYVLAAGIAIITYLFLQVCTELKLTNWDDLGYVITNQLIKDSSSEGLHRVFNFEHPMDATVMGNYHPITMVTYWYDYSKVALEPYLYHLHNLLFHLLATVAVYGFVKVLTRRTVAAVVAALLFGLHPMHVESVAWVAGRKDLIYGFFYVLAMTTYLFYVRNKSGKALWYIATIILFGLSLLAKSVGVTLPVVLLLLDFYENRPMPWKDMVQQKKIFTKETAMVLLDKIPFFAMSIFMGELSVKAQAQIGALQTGDTNFSGIERFALGFYALFTYIWKAIVPVGLTNFYPYPLKEGNALPGLYYAFPFIILGLAAAVVWFGRKNKVVLWGSAFFVVNLLLLLQFVAVGGAIVSDRYSYIPYLGLFLIAGWFVSEYFERKETAGTGKTVLGIVVAYSLVLGGMANARAKTWYDSVTLWKDNIEKHPESPTGYFYLGQEYYTRYEKSTNPQEQQVLGDSAMYYFNQSVAHKPDYLNPIVCIGDYQRAHGQIAEAKATYIKARTIDPKNESPYQGLGVVYAIMQQYDSSEYNFREALSIKPNSEAESNLANLFNIEGKNDSSLAHYAKAIALNPDSYIPYMNRAKIYTAMSRWKEAIADYDRAIAIRPETGEPYFRRGTCYGQLGDQAKAKADIDQARARGFNGQ